MHKQASIKYKQQACVSEREEGQMGKMIDVVS